MKWLIVSRRGFSLVELLVVFAILGLIMAMLLPSISRSKDMARLIECQSRERTIFLLATNYREDNRQFYPACHYYNTAGTINQTFGFSIRPYLPIGMNDITSYNFTYKTNLLLCPATKYRYYTNPTFTAAAGAWPHIYAGAAHESGYGIAMQFGGGNDDSWTTPTLRFRYRPRKEVTRPTSIAYMTEIAGNTPYLFYTTVGPVKYNHMEDTAINVTMSDGQVKAYYENLSVAWLRPIGDPRRLDIW